ncbi:MAG: GFA family protein [Novosphingobium sp.]
MEGRCTCGKVRYRLKDRPIIVHCCHCRWCQRESGASFALNAVIEADNVELLGEAPERVELPSQSGKGQSSMRCPECKVSVWGHYHVGPGDKACFIRVGTLENPDLCPPDVHIYTDSKQPWVTLSGDTPPYPGFYPGRDIPGLYGEERAARMKALR